MQDIKLHIMKAFALVVCLVITLGFVSAGISYAKTAKEIDTNVEASLERFHKEVKGTEEFLKSAKGVLVLPGVIKGGFVFGQKGLMYNLTLEGSKFTKLKK